MAITIRIRIEDIIDRVVENIDYGHGMHVTGIIGANCQVEEEISENNGLKGIAPEVQILAMKIFSMILETKGHQKLILLLPSKMQ